MDDSQVYYGVRAILKSLSVREEEKKWKLLRSIAVWVGWFLILFVWGIYLLSPELRERGPWIYIWLAGCLVYQVLREAVSRITRKFYETSLFCMVRIQIMAFLGSSLVLLTDGVRSYFWFIYLWPLFASTLYLPWAMTWVIYGEVAALYSLSSLATGSGITSNNFALLFTNLAVLFVLTIVFRYLVESIKRYQVAERKLKYSEMLQQIQRDIDTAIDLQEMLGRILRRAVELVGVRDGSLMLVDEQGELRFRARVGRSLPEGEVEWTFKPGEGIAGLVVQSGRPYICYDAKTDPHFIPLPSKIAIRSLISVPIISPGTVLGVINVDSPEPERFSGTDADLLVALADRVAAAIERAELLESLRQIGEKTIDGVEAPYQHIVDAVHWLTGCPVAMWRMDERRKRARIVASRGVRTEYMQEAVVDLDRRSVTGKAIRERTTVQVLDIQTDPDFQNKEAAAREGWQSYLAVPLLAGPERAVGTLSIYSERKRKQFTRWELDVLRAFASQAGVAIHSNDLIKQLTVLIQRERTLRRQAEMLREISGAISSADELREVAETILDELGRVIEYNKASLQLIREEEDARILLAARGFDAKAVDRWFLRPISQDRLASRIVASKEPLILSEPSKDPDWGIHPATADVKSWVGIPLVYEQETIGLLTLDHDQPGFYTQTIKDQLISFANQVAIDIRNVRLFDSAQRRIRDLEIVNEVVQVISVKLDTKDLLQTIVSQIVDKLNCTHCTLFFPQEEEGELLLVPQVTNGVHPERIRTRRFKPGEGLAGWVFQNGKSLVLGDAKEDKRFAPARERREQPRSMLVAPVKVGDQTIGVISADQDAFGWFSESDRRLVDALALQAGIAIERARGLELLQDIGNRIISLQDVQNIGDILRQIVSGAIALTNTNTGVIYLISEDDQSVADSFCPPGFEHPRPRLERKEGLTRHVVETGEVLSIPDIHQDPRVNPVLLDHFQSMIAVPLKIEEKVVGVLYLNDEDQHDFTETEVSLLLTLASQAAIAIENARLLEEATKRAEGMVFANGLGRELSATRDIKEIPRLLVRETIKAFNAEAGSLALIDAETKEIEFQFALDYKGIEKFEIMKGYRIPLDKGIAGTVMKSGVPLISNNAQKDPRWHREVDSVTGFTTRSILAVPMVYSNQVIGVIEILNKRDGSPFLERERDCLTVLASSAAIAVENARLDENLQRRVKGLEMLNQVAGRMSTSLDRQEIFQTVVEAVRATLGTTHCTLFILDDDGVLVPQATAGVPFEVIEKRRFRLGEGLAGWVAQEGQSTLVLDANKDPRFRPGMTAKPGTPRSMVLAPLRVEGEVTGVICADQDRVAAFDEKDQQLLDTLSVQVDNTMRYWKLQQRIVELASTKEQLVDAEKMLVMSRFATDFIHRVNNMIGTIPIWTRQMEERLQERDFEDDDVDLYLSHISADAKRVRDVTTQLIESTTQSPIKEMLDIVGLMQTIARRIRVMTPDEISTVEKYPAEPVFVRAVRIELETTLWDIAWNGVQAIKPIGTGTLMLSVDRVSSSYQGTQRQVRIEIHDNGIGIREGQPVFTALYSTKGGLGYGLWRAKKVIEELGGKIGYKSVPGGNTTFWIELPEAVREEADDREK